MPEEKPVLEAILAHTIGVRDTPLSVGDTVNTPEGRYVMVSSQAVRVLVDGNSKSTDVAIRWEKAIPDELVKG